MKRNAKRNSHAADAAFGFKAHSGWAALVVLAQRDGEIQVLERSRVTLVDKGWQKQPYHAAEELPAAEASRLVKRGVAAATQGALREVRAALRRTRESGCEVKSCGVLVGEPMPEWSVAEILAVHFRMHKAEGVLFRQVLADAAEASELQLVAVPEKRLLEYAEDALGTPATTLLGKIAALGKQVGAPWGKDQKDAALAALIALTGTRA